MTQINKFNFLEDGGTMHDIFFEFCCECYDLGSEEKYDVIFTFQCYLTSYR